MVTQHVDYTEIPIPKELGAVFNDTSESPAIMIAPDASTLHMYHISPFNKLKEKTREAYLNNFALALKNAGYSPPANKQNDPLVYSHWYSSANIDPFKVVKANSVEYANLSTGVVNARSSALLSVAVQGILECLKHKSFDKPTCKKLLRDHFIYFDFQHRAKKETGKKFNKQIETAKDKDSSIPWGEWMEMAKKFH
jgi:hypothetical protein